MHEFLLFCYYSTQLTKDKSKTKQYAYTVDKKSLQYFNLPFSPATQLIHCHIKTTSTFIRTQQRQFYIIKYLGTQSFLSLTCYFHPIIYCKTLNYINNLRDRLEIKVIKFYCTYCRAFQTFHNMNIWPINTSYIGTFIIHYTRDNIT